MKFLECLPNPKLRRARTEAQKAAYASREMKQRLAEDRSGEENIAAMVDLSPEERASKLQMHRCNSFNRDIFSEHEDWKDAKAAALFAASTRCVQPSQRPLGHELRASGRSSRSHARKAATGDSGDGDGPAPRIVLLHVSYISTIPSSKPSQQIPDHLKYLAYLNINTVEAITGYKHSSIYAMMKKGTFPKNHRIGPQKCSWKTVDIEEWVKSRLQLNDEVE